VSDPDAVAPLSVEADLAVTVNGVEAEVESTGRRLLVRFRSLPDAFRALGGQPDGAETALGGLSAATALTAEIRVRDRIVAVAGADARPGPVAWSLGVDPVEVRLDGTLGAVGAVGAEAAASGRRLARLVR